jgi:hypothetical protein
MLHLPHLPESTIEVMIPAERCPTPNGFTELLPAGLCPRGGALAGRKL